LLKNYEKIYYWQTDGKSNWLENIKTNPKELPYLVEPRGEAICWDPAESGYFTLSEEANNISPHLYYYPRLHSSNSESYSAGDLFR
jgi:hypothetical protein